MPDLISDLGVVETFPLKHQLAPWSGHTQSHILKCGFSLHCALVYVIFIVQGSSKVCYHPQCTDYTLAQLFLSAFCSGLYVDLSNFFPLQFTLH